MLLTQRQPTLLPMQHPQAPSQQPRSQRAQRPVHRRAPSAPHTSAPQVVAVAPTRTPGLLSLSKPLSVSNSASKPRGRKPASSSNNRAPKGKKLEPSPEKKSSLGSASANVSGAEEGNGNATTNKAAKSKSSSPSPRRRQRSPAATANPPSPLQAETTPVPSDPFLSSSNNTGSTTPVPGIIPVITKPTGKLANRRRGGNGNQTNQPQFQPQAKTSPVPAQSRRRARPVSEQLPAMARSAPDSTASTIWDHLVRDDVTEVGASPRTPSPSPAPRHTVQRTLTDSGPRTAPLSSFPFNRTPSPTPASRTKNDAMRARNHMRSPSEGVFSMMSEAATHSEPMIMPFPPRKPLNLTGSMRGMSMGSTPPRKGASAGMSAKEKQAAIEDGSFFANSVFQNSPSPDELPPPPF